MPVNHKVKHGVDYKDMYLGEQICTGVQWLQQTPHCYLVLAKS